MHKLKSTSTYQLYLLVTKRLLLVLAMYQLIRLVFFIANKSFFEDVSLLDYLSLAFYSLRFDLSLVFAVNLPFIFFSLLPFSFTSISVYRKSLSVFFLVTNIICFIFDIADIGYFPYVRKRMTSEVFHLLFKQSDFIDLLPSYLVEFWYVVLLIVGVMVGFIFLNNKISKSFKSIDNQLNIKYNIILLFITIGFSIVLIRGGLQLKPIQTVNGLLYARNRDLPLVVNTPFSISHSFEQKKLTEEIYFSEKELATIFQPIKNYHHAKPLNSMNVVLIILESFGKGYTGLSNQKSYTPFLDSLMTKSYIMSNAFANAYRSSDGIPACVAGIPHFMDESFETSPYATNAIDALPALLRKTNYSTSFFHGGTNGTMGFDVFASSAGFEKYYGRTEYANDNDYDGTWGIWDGYYLPYVAKQLSTQKQPFFSTVFTLSSHEPFKLPRDFKNDSIRKLQGIARGIAYTDDCLRLFFKEISTQPWYDNTLFVITPDHNYLAGNNGVNNFYHEGLGLFSIPIMFYMPKRPDFKANDRQVFQQIDIMPTILDLIHYPNSFFAYGKSAFDTTNAAYAYCLIDKYHYMLVNDRVVGGVENTIDGIYDFKSDSLLTTKLPSNDSLSKVATQKYKAMRQLLTTTVGQNKQSLRTYKK